MISQIKRYIENKPRLGQQSEGIKHKKAPTNRTYNYINK